MENFYHTCKFSTLTTNFSELWPREIFDLGKQFNLMIHLGNVLKTSLQNVLKMSWRLFCKTSSRRRSWRHFCKTFSRRLEDVLKTFLQDVFKTSWKHRENVLERCLENVLKTSWKCMSKTNVLVLIRTSSRRLLITYE